MARRRAQLLLMLALVSVARCLPLCGPSDESFSGTWRAVRQSSPSVDVLGYCPATLAAIRLDYQRHYVCEGNRTYDIKHFEPSVCRLHALQRTLPELAACLGGANIAFVGDSLMRQQYFSLRCELERVASLSASFFDSHYLCAHMPCLTACAMNNTFREQNSERTRNGLCTSCDENGQPRAPLPIAQEPWLATLPNTTRALVIGSGAWWNEARVGADESRLYLHMLATVAPALHNLTRAGMHVLWMDIAPQGAKALEHSSYGWQHFGMKNEEARRKLRALAPAVIFMNTSAAMAARRSSEPNSVTTAGLHWCSPGQGTVPAFITQHVAHILLEDCQSRP
jgi:hypothetical protein